MHYLVYVKREKIEFKVSFLLFNVYNIIFKTISLFCWILP